MSLDPLYIIELRRFISSFLPLASRIALSFTCKTFLSSSPFCSTTTSSATTTTTTTAPSSNPTSTSPFPLEYSEISIPSSVKIYGRGLIERCIESGNVNLVRWAVEDMKAPLLSTLSSFSDLVSLIPETPNDDTFALCEYFLPLCVQQIVAWNISGDGMPKFGRDFDGQFQAARLRLRLWGKFGATVSLRTADRLSEIVAQYEARADSGQVYNREALLNGIAGCGDVEVAKRFFTRGKESGSFFHAAREVDDIDMFFFLEGWHTYESQEEHIWLLISHLKFTFGRGKCLSRAIESVRRNPNLRHPVTSTNEFVGCFESYGERGFLEGLKILLLNRRLLFEASSIPQMVPYLTKCLKFTWSSVPFQNPATVRFIFDYLCGSDPSFKENGYSDGEGVFQSPPKMLDLSVIKNVLKDRYLETLTFHSNDLSVAQWFTEFLTPYLKQLRAGDPTPSYSREEVSSLVDLLYQSGIVELFPLLEKYGFGFTQERYDRLVLLWKTAACMPKEHCFRHLRLAYYLRTHGFPGVDKDWREHVFKFHFARLRYIMQNLLTNGYGVELLQMHALCGDEKLGLLTTEDVLFSNIRFLSKKDDETLRSKPYSLCKKIILELIEIRKKKEEERGGSGGGRRWKEAEMNVRELKEIWESATLQPALKRDFFEAVGLVL